MRSYSLVDMTGLLKHLPGLHDQKSHGVWAESHPDNADRLAQAREQGFISRQETVALLDELASVVAEENRQRNTNDILFDADAGNTAARAELIDAMHRAGISTGSRIPSRDNNYQLPYDEVRDHVVYLENRVKRLSRLLSSEYILEYLKAGGTHSDITIDVEAARSDTPESAFMATYQEEIRDKQKRAVDAWKKEVFTHYAEILALTGYSADIPDALQRVQDVIGDWSIEQSRAAAVIARLEGNPITHHITQNRNSSQFSVNRIAATELITYTRLVADALTGGSINQVGSEYSWGVGSLTSGRGSFIDQLGSYGRQASDGLTRVLANIAFHSMSLTMPRGSVLRRMVMSDIEGAREGQDVIHTDRLSNIEAIARSHALSRIIQEEWSEPAVSAAVEEFKEKRAAGGPPEVVQRRTREEIRQELMDRISAPFKFDVPLPNDTRITTEVSIELGYGAQPTIGLNGVIFLQDAEGGSRRIGSWQYRLNPHEGKVYRAYVNMSGAPDAIGHGVMALLGFQEENMLLAAGYERATWNAADLQQSVVVPPGTYVWASRGAEWANMPHTVIRAVNRYRRTQDYRQLPSLVKSAVDDIASRFDSERFDSPNYPTPREVSQVGRLPQFGDWWPGKLIMAQGGAERASVLEAEQSYSKSSPVGGPNWDAVRDYSNTDGLRVTPSQVRDEYLQQAVALGWVDPKYDFIMVDGVAVDYVAPSPGLDDAVTSGLRRMVERSASGEKPPPLESIYAGALEERQAARQSESAERRRTAAQRAWETRRARAVAANQVAATEFITLRDGTVVPIDGNRITDVSAAWEAALRSERARRAVATRRLRQSQVA